MKTGLVRWEWHSLDHVGAVGVRDRSADDGDAVGLVSPQLDRSRARREHLHLGAQHLGRLSAGRRHAARSSGASAASRAPSRWGRARKRRGSTTGASSPTARSPSSTTARTRRSTASRAPCGSRSTSRPTKRASSPPTRTRTRRCSPQARATCRRWRTGTPSSATAGCRRSASTPQDGSLLFDAHLPFDMAFYRAFRFPWSGRPLSPPAVLASLNDTGEETIVHASWNGATEVAVLARARGQAARIAGGAGHDPGQRLRKLDDPARASTPTWRCRRSTRPAACSAPRGRSRRSATPPRSRAPGGRDEGDPRWPVSRGSVGRFGGVLVRGRRRGAARRLLGGGAPAFAAAPRHRDGGARAATSVSMAVSGVLLIGRAPIVARGLGRSPYQAFAAPIAV